MKTLQVTLQHCYGITSFDHEFDFGPWAGRNNETKHSQTAIIYARNGAMKTSFAKMFDKLASREDPEELVYGKPAHASVLADGATLPPEAIFVIKSQPDYFESDGMGALLADQAKQAAYAKIMQDIMGAQTALISTIKTRLGGRTSDEEVLKRFDTAFRTSEASRLAKLVDIADAVKASSDAYLAVSYKVIDDPKVDAFLAKPDTHAILNTYFETYKKILEASTYFSDAYDYNNALSVQKAIDTNNFLRAKNKLVLSDGTEVGSNAELKALYQADKDKIFASPELKKQFDAFDTKIRSNAELRAFRTFVQEHPDLVPFLANPEQFKQQVWYAQLAASDGRYEALVGVYQAKRDELAKLYRESEAAITQWHEVVERFNRSFGAPFTVDIGNKRDAILGQTKPVLEFIYDNGHDVAKQIDFELLTRHILSSGERRALYILCVMFELESHAVSGGEHVVVIDDIADSFDYKNKYAIIEYLHRLSRDSSNGLYLIIMTHNFDFYRCVRLRCWGGDPAKAVIAQRDSAGNITLTGGGQPNEFDRFKAEIRGNPAVFLASIPFARSLIEYARGNQDPQYIVLTSALHQKPTTSSLTVRDLAGAIGSAVTNINLAAYQTGQLFTDLLNTTVQAIISAPDETKLEHKIVIAMAIRLAAETYMAGRFASDGKSLAPDNGNQTSKWFVQFTDPTEYTDTDRAYSVLQQVMLMTPESIHLNSFMYEPIMDMSLTELVKLYQDVSSLKQS